ncbi:MAG: LPS export ABC transporter periplasmic protein LptC [Candidatus Krumholzibacteria bacterium]|nr:LPS export ABC transporter periplasmic protein LptC [Candidatus Krumholzibacteria bacterium]
MMPPRRSRCRTVAAMVAPAVGLMLLLACGPAGEEQPQLQPTAGGGGPQPEQKFYDSHIIESTAGVRQWVLEYDEMTKYVNRQDVDLVRIKMDFFRDGVYFSTLVSDSGIANLKTRNVFVWGNVRITTQDGRRLRTSELTYDNADGRIRNEVFNILDRGLDVVTGIGLEATPDLDYIEIKQEVAAEVGDETVQSADTPRESP